MGTQALINMNPKVSCLLWSYAPLPIPHWVQACKHHLSPPPTHTHLPRDLKKVKFAQKDETFSAHMLLDLCSSCMFRDNVSFPQRRSPLTRNILRKFKSHDQRLSSANQQASLLVERERGLQLLRWKEEQQSPGSDLSCTGSPVKCFLVSGASSWKHIWHSRLN